MTGYMMEMRKLVGSRPIFQNGASVIVVNEDGHILLGLRSDNGCWSYAGGSIELGENLETAAARELLEEFGIRANKLKLFNVFSGEGFYYKYPNGHEVHNIDVVFICDDYEGTPVVDDDEMIECRFFQVDALPERISPPTVKVVEAYCEMVKGDQ